ncbi:MAG: hypothetical protein ACE5JA_02060 [bacterium]
MRNLLPWAALAALIFLTSCEEDIDANPPESPTLLPHTAETDTLPVEVGIDALPGCNCILLQWIPNTEEDLAEYEIFRSTQENSGYVSLTIVPNSESTYTDNNLSPLFARYYYYMVAKDRLGNTSEPSAGVNYKLTGKPVPNAPAKWDTVSSDSVLFEWTWDGGLEGMGFLTRLYSLDADSTCWMGWTNAYVRPLRIYSPAVPAGDYKWRVDYIGTMGSSKDEGSESNWVPFSKK